MNKLIILTIILTIGLSGSVYINRNFYPIWNSNKVKVYATKPLTTELVKIEHGISANSINRANDLSLFQNKEKYNIVFDKRPRKKIYNDYGENDFLITYDNKYYSSFRQFKTNWRHQHTYKFTFWQADNVLFVKVDISGINNMEFTRKMIKIDDAEHH